MRARWVPATFGVSIRTLANRMKESSFTAKSTEGFLIDRVRDDLIEARFIEKNSFVESYRDPFGREVSFDRVSYKEIDFTLSSRYPNLELRNPPRGILAFVSRLLTITDFSLALTPVDVNVLDWVQRIEKRLGARAQINTLQVTDLQFEDEVSGKLTLVSQKDVRGSLVKIAKGLPHKLEKVHCRFSGGDREIVMVLSSSGSINLREEDCGFYLPVVRESLPK